MTVFIRADAGGTLGTGHVMRCLALADALAASGARVSFVSRDLPEPIQQIVEAHGHAVCPLDGATDDAASTRATLCGRTVDWVVVDHYGLDASWETAMRASARHLLVIDDLANRPHDCDILLDQNLWPNPRRYDGLVPSACRTLFGPLYALLRPEFHEARAQARPAEGAVRRVLVSFGGTDPAGGTQVALDALTGIDAGLHVDVVVGAAHPDREALQAECARRGYACHIQSARMAALMAEADLAIGAGGVSMWERCAVGLPTVTVAIASNQEEGVAEAARRGLLYQCPGPPEAHRLRVHIQALADNPPLRRLISENGRRVVDGLGVGRVAGMMRGLDITVRRATIDDAELMHRGRNSPVSRRGSRETAEIPWDAHVAWLERTLADPDRLLLVGELDGVPVGVVRFDIDGTAAEGNEYRVPGARGQGLAIPLLMAAERALKAERPDVTTFKGFVKDDNRTWDEVVLSYGFRSMGRLVEKPLA